MSLTKVSNTLRIATLLFVCSLFHVGCSPVPRVHASADQDKAAAAKKFQESMEAAEAAGDLNDAERAQLQDLIKRQPSGLTPEEDAEFLHLLIRDKKRSAREVAEKGCGGTNVTFSDVNSDKVLVWTAPLILQPTQRNLNRLDTHAVEVTISNDPDFPVGSQRIIIHPDNIDHIQYHGTTTIRSGVSYTRKQNGTEIVIAGQGGQNSKLEEPDEGGNISLVYQNDKVHVKFKNNLVKIIQGPGYTPFRMFVTWNPTSQTGYIYASQIEAGRDVFVFDINGKIRSKFTVSLKGPLSPILNLATGTIEGLKNSHAVELMNLSKKQVEWINVALKADMARVNGKLAELQISKDYKSVVVSYELMNNTDRLRILTADGQSRDLIEDKCNQRPSIVFTTVEGEFQGEGGNIFYQKFSFGEKKKRLTVVMHGGPSTNLSEAYSATDPSGLSEQLDSDIIFVDYLGSAGYGLQFEAAIFGKIPEVAEKQCRSISASVKSQFGDQYSQIGIFGSSFGSIFAIPALNTELCDFDYVALELPVVALAPHSIWRPMPTHASNLWGGRVGLLRFNQWSERVQTSARIPVYVSYNTDDPRLPSDLIDRWIKSKPQSSNWFISRNEFGEHMADVTTINGNPVEEKFRLALNASLDSKRQSPNKLNER